MEDLDNPGSAAAIPLEQISSILESVNYTVAVLDPHAIVRYINQAGEKVIGRSRSDIVGRRAPEALPEFFGKSFSLHHHSSGVHQACEFEEYFPPLDLWSEIHLCPSPCGVLACIRDISGKKRHERILTGQQHVLEMVAQGAPLTTILNAITALVEQQSSNDLSTILLLSDDGRRLHLGSGGSVAPEYNAAIEGAEIGSNVGSCGTAAHARQRIIVSDIDTDPRWRAYREVALRHGLRACWSQPIMSRDGAKVLGTIANYSRRAGDPARQSLLLLAIAAHLAQVAIEADHHAAERKRIESRLVAEAAVTGILATAGSIAEAAPRILGSIGKNCDWEVGAWWAIDQKDNLLRCTQFWSSSPHHAAFEEATRNLTLERGTGLPGRVWAKGASDWVGDVGADPSFLRHALALQSGLHGAVAFPVLQGDQVCAVIEFFASTIRPPDRQVQTMLTVSGGQIGQWMQRIAVQEQLRAARDVAEKANRAKDRFLATLSHELRTPLSPALLIANSTARDPRLTPEVRENLLLIEKCIHLQTRLINDLLDLSRIENNKISLQLKPVDLHQLVHDCLRMCDEDLRNKRMAVYLNLEATHHGLAGDPLRLRQIICNLIKNAAKFTPADGSVMVSSANPTQDLIQLSVADNGIGATPEVISTIFEPFEQGGRGSESGGLGLGLTICKGLTEAHGGKIWASSQGPGSGLTVTLEFPTSSAEPAAEVVAPQAPLAGAQTPLRILLVDDHPETLRALSQLLQGLEHSVTTADCVRSALAAADVNDFDLLISDLGLPDGTGTGLMQELLKRRPLKGIAVTGYGMESDVQKCRDAGFFAHLTKPIDLDQLEEAILKSAQ